MGKIAQLPDGTRLEFPDDTPDEVIQKTVKRELNKIKFAEAAQSSGVSGARDFVGDMLLEAPKMMAGGLAGLGTLAVSGDPNRAAQTVRDVQNWQMDGDYDNPTSTALKESWAEGMQKIGDAANVVGGGVIGAGAVLSGQGLDVASQQSQQVEQDGIIRFVEDALLDAGVAPEVVALAKGGIASGATFLGAKGMMRQDPTHINPRTNRAEIDPFGRKKEPPQKDIRDKLERNSTDKDTAKYELVPNNPNWNGRNPNDLTLADMSMQKNRNAIAVINEGFDQQMIPPMREMASSSDIYWMKKQTEIARNMKNNGISEITDSPLDVLGELSTNRFEFIAKELRAAGEQVGLEADNLRGQQVDFSPAINSFENSLDALGIKINRSGDYQLDYSNSIIKGKLLKKSRKAIDDVVEQLKGVSGNPDAWQVHNMKKALDEVLYQGSTKKMGGYTGKTERIIQELRANLDAVLDGNFSSYDLANSNYMKLREAMEQFETITGKKWSITDSTAKKQIGQKLRTLGSNYASKYPILNAINIIEKTAKEFGGKFENDLILQAMFANKLNKRFRLDGDNTFKALTTQADLDSFSKAGLTDKALKAASKRIMRRDDETAFQALSKYLKELEEKK